MTKKNFQEDEKSGNFKSKIRKVGVRKQGLRIPTIFDDDQLKYPGKMTRPNNLKRRSRFKRDLPMQNDQ